MRPLRDKRVSMRVGVAAGVRAVKLYTRPVTPIINLKRRTFVAYPETGVAGGRNVPLNLNSGTAVRNL